PAAPAPVGGQNLRYAAGRGEAAGAGNWAEAGAGLRAPAVTVIGLRTSARSVTRSHSKPRPQQTEQ
ncbi:hypothetical protein, partial [Streptomyces sp900116325]|uniref:hypothetical protein n=1 Tax=Streptomyces sp. 900116325 TaxID=3154295 RepID=UPI0033A736AC